MQKTMEAEDFRKEFKSLVRGQLEKTAETAYLKGYHAAIENLKDIQAQGMKEEDWVDTLEAILAMMYKELTDEEDKQEDD